MEKSRKVNKGFYLSFLVLPLCAFGPLEVRAEEIGGHIISRLEQKALATQSYKASFDLLMRIGGNEFTLTGVTLYKWPKMLRVEMSLRDQKELSQVLYLKDGAAWQYLPMVKVAFHRDEEALRKKFPDTYASQELLNIQDPFDLVESKTVKFLDEERTGKGTTYLFEGIPKQAIQHQGVLTPTLCRMRIAEQDGLLRDLVMYDATGREILKQHFWDIQQNLDLLEEEFVFKPEDVKLVEVTQETEKKMRLFLEKESPQ